MMVVVGLGIGFDLDRKFQTLVLRAFPSYGSGLTVLETVEPVTRALEERRTGSAAGAGSSEVSGSASGELSWRNPPETGQTSDYGPAPELIAKGAWINSEPLTMEELKGKVVLVDFWTYSCINCIRTIPYLQEWHEKYSSQGLVIIGVHSPEFAFERNEGNLRKAVEDLGVSWPVVQDNDFSQWRAYDNRYWPAHYFIDAGGRVRYFHFGEGKYEASEMVIRELLAEAGTPASEPFAQSESGEGRREPRTPETYLGYGRSSSFSGADYAQDKSVLFSLPQELEIDEWGFEGRWTIREQFIENDETGRLALRFRGKKVFLVIQPVEDGSRIELSLDGMIPSDTEDVEQGVLEPVENRLYQLVDLEASSEHLLELNVEGRVRLYAFTFG